MVAALTTLGFGGAMGLEGPSLYLGASIGTLLQQRFRRWFGTPDRRVLLVAGAAAGVAAIFKAPATGAVFALEVPYQDDLARHMLLPALVASATSYLSFVAINGTEPILAVARQSGVLVRRPRGRRAPRLARRRRRARLRVPDPPGQARLDHEPPLLRVVGAGLTMAAVFGLGELLTTNRSRSGSGTTPSTGRSRPTAPSGSCSSSSLLRCLATAATVAGGGVGGLFIPLVVAGALLGRAVGGIVGDFDTSLFLVIGVAAFLGAGYRVPLAAVMFVAESTGRPGFVVPGLLAAVTAELIMGRSSVTTYQVASGGRHASDDELPPSPP